MIGLGFPARLLPSSEAGCRHSSGGIPFFKVNCQFTVMLTVVVVDNVPDVAVTVAE
jgi:hypothetical protein